MKILFLNPTGRIGGAEIALLELMAGLRDAEPSWRLELVTGSEGPLPGRAMALGAGALVLPFPEALAQAGEWSAAARPWRRLAALRRLSRAAWPARRYLRELRDTVRLVAPDLLHTNGLKMHLLGARAAPAGTPLVWHLHDYVAGRPFSAFALKRSAYACSAVVTPSQSVADDFRSLGARVPQPTPIWNAVDLLRFSPEGRRLDLDDRSGLPRAGEGVVRIGLIATLAHWKGHLTFLDAVARLAPGLNVRAYIIGGAVYESAASQISLASLRAHAARLGLADRVGFTGFIDNPAPALRALDVVVHASTSPEPFGLAVAEGMASGRAVIVSLAGGASEIVTPDLDVLSCAPGDTTGLAGAIERLVRDADLRQRLGRAARLAAEQRFSRQRFIAAMLGVYRSAVSDRLTRTRIEDHAAGERGAAAIGDTTLRGRIHDGLRAGVRR